MNGASPTERFSMCTNSIPSASVTLTPSAVGTEILVPIETASPRVGELGVDFAHPAPVT
jgi:hypothetical protein